MSRKPNSECQIMVFQPTMEEFADFSRYIQYMESQGAHRGGVAKIIPPKEWSPCKTYDNIDNLVIPAPISQVVTGQKGLFTQYNIQQKPMTVKEMRRLTNTDRYASPFHDCYEDLERTYWKNITFNPAIYGADISGSLYDKDVDVWNVSRLDTILDLVQNDTGVKIEGVNTAYLYFGMWKTSFAWHTEDMDLYSINYVHFGAPKTWYSVPPEHGKRLERLASGFFPNSKSTCPAFLRHKMTLISPSVLRKYGIPYNKITQEAGEFMITFPYGYHSGFNHGFNCAESTNFASERWIDYGIAAEKCRCWTDMVYINMDLFVKTFQPEKYELWKGNKSEVKLSYTDIPPVPDFTKDAVHWRTKIENIRKVSNTALVPEACKTPQKIGATSTKSKQSPTSSRKESNKKLTGVSKVPIVKVEKTPALAAVRFKEVSPRPAKKFNTKRSLSAGAIEDIKCTSPGTSGCLLSPPSSCQLKMGSVLPLHSISNEVKNLPQDPSSCFPTIMDRVKMGRRKLFCDDGGTSSQTTRDVLQSSINCSFAALPPNSDHNMYTKPLQKFSSKATPSSSVPVKSQTMSPACSQSSQQQTPSAMLKVSEFHIDENTVSTLRESAHKNEIDYAGVMSSSNSGQIVINSSQDLKQEYTSTGASSDTKITKDSKSEASDNKMSGDSNILSTSQKVGRKPPLKRRHPVSKKGPSKKSGPTVLLKTASADSSSEDDNSLGKKESKKRRGRQKVKPESYVETEGYPSLWIRRKTNLKAERQYNATVAKLSPYCAICSLFQPYYQKSLNSNQKPPALADILAKCEVPPPGTKTKPLIPETIFATSIDDPAPLATCELLDEEGKSPLIQCKACKVQVHASCYGIAKPQNPWTCDRCSFKAWVAQCTLCCMRGGALKPVNDGLQWAHILCAIAIPEVCFDDIPRRDGVNIKKLSQARQKLKCTYCRRNKYWGLHHEGTCIQCCAGACAISFHPTCAHAAGVKMEPGDWPHSVFVYCHRHALQKERAMEQKTDKALPDVRLEQKVYGKHKNGRYYPCVIRSETSENFHHVIFTDKSWSDNLYQQDIISHDFSVSPPKEGDTISVRWIDGKSYEAEYVRCKKHQVLMVEFEDGSFLSLKREDVFTSMDDMPQRIRRKLSNATLMSSPDHLKSPEKTDVHAQSYVRQRAAFYEGRKKKLAGTENPTHSQDEKNEMT